MYMFITQACLVYSLFIHCITDNNDDRDELEMARGGVAAAIGLHLG